MLEKLESCSEKLWTFMRDNPEWCGLIIAGIGVVLILAALMDWDWNFSEMCKRNLKSKKLSDTIGWLGHNTGRMYVGIGGVLLILFGLVWFWVYRYYL